MFDGVLDEEPDEPERISLVMEGMNGKSFMIIDGNSAYPALKYAKELVDQGIVVDSNGDLERNQISPILKNWMADQVRYVESLGTDAYRVLEGYEIKFEAAAQVLEKQLEIMHEEELDGRRMTFQVADARCWSVSSNSSLKELEAAKRIFANDLDSRQLSKLEGFIANAETERQGDDWMEEPIKLKALSELFGARHEIRKDMHPDQLTVFLEKRWKDLSNEEGDKIVSWIENSELRKEDHEHRVRVFKNGLFSPEESIEIDISEHDIDYVESIYILRSDGAGMLPEHWRRLDRYYEELLGVSDERRAVLRQEKGLEVPTGDPDKVVFVNQHMDKETLITVDLNYRGFLGKSGQAELTHYIEIAVEVLDPENTIRVYSFPRADYKIISKEDKDEVLRVWNEIEKTDSSVFVSAKDYFQTIRWKNESLAPDVEVERGPVEVDVDASVPAKSDVVLFMGRQVLNKVDESAETCLSDGVNTPDKRADFIVVVEASKFDSNSPVDMNTHASATEEASPSSSQSPSPGSPASMHLDKQDLEKLERVFEELYSTLGRLLNKNEPGRDRDVFERKI